MPNAGNSSKQKGLRVDNKVERILFRSPNWLGDAILSLPALQVTRQLYPQAEIIVVAKPRVSGIFSQNPLVQEVISYDPEGHKNKLPYYYSFVNSLEQKKFDLGLILPNSFSSALMAYLAKARARVGYNTEGRGMLLTQKLGARELRKKHLSEEYLDLVRALGWKGKSKGPRLYLDHDHGEKILEMTKGTKGKPWVALACGATFGPAKHWFPEHFAELGRRLIKEKKAHLFFLGTTKEYEASQVVIRMMQVKGGFTNLCGLTDLNQLGVVLEKCKLLVCNDSGIMHMGAALQVPLVAIFGSTSPVWTRPLGRKNKVLYERVFCSPCFKPTCYRTDVPYDCLKKVTPEKAWAACREVWL